MSLHPKRHHREVRLDWALQLPESLPAPEPPPGTEPEELEELPTLPNFPEGLGLTTLQHEAIARWYRQQQANVYDCARHLLATEPEDSLHHYICNAVLLGRLLRLHPACNHSVAELARALHVDKSDLAARSRNIARAAASAHRHNAPQRTLTITELIQAFPQLDFSRRQGKLPELIVPFRNPRLTLAEQWSTATSLATIPGITASLAETKDNHNAIRITFPAQTRNRHLHAMSTSAHNATADALSELLTPTIALARRTLAIHCMQLPTADTRTLTGYLDSLHTYATTRHGAKDLTPREQAEAARHLYLLANRLQEFEPRLAPAAIRLHTVLYA